MVPTFTTTRMTLRSDPIGPMHSCVADYSGRFRRWLTCTRLIPMDRNGGGTLPGALGSAQPPPVSPALGHSTSCTSTLPSHPWSAQNYTGNYPRSERRWLRLTIKSTRTDRSLFPCEEPYECVVVRIPIVVNCCILGKCYQWSVSF